MTRRFIVQHFEKALQRGWIPFFAKAAIKYDFPLALLMAIASRETNMTNMKGDYRKSKHFPSGGYHGYGIMQVDVGTDPAWIATSRWQNVDEAIMHGAKILDAKRDELNRVWQGSRTLQQFLWVLTASYNHGVVDSYRDFRAEGSPDGDTTGHDYGKDVLGRMAEFQELLTARGITATSYAVSDVSNLADLSASPSVDASAKNTTAINQLSVPGGGAGDKITTIATTAPVKSGGVKAAVAAIGAMIWAALQFLGIQTAEAYGYIKTSFADNPMMTLVVVLLFISGIVIYWKYQDRQTQLDKQREQNAHERDMANQRTLANPKEVNVVVLPPVPDAQQPNGEAEKSNDNGNQN